MGLLLFLLGLGLGMFCLSEPIYAFLIVQIAIAMHTTTVAIGLLPKNFLCMKRVPKSHVTASHFALIELHIFVINGQFIAIYMY